MPEENWLRQIFFHEEERFHPIALAEAFSMVEDLYSELPGAAQDEWRVSRLIRQGGNSGVIRAFHPPIVHVPDGDVEVGDTRVGVVRVMNDGSSGLATLGDQDVAEDAVVTHAAPHAAVGPT